MNLLHVNTEFHCTETRDYKHFDTSFVVEKTTIAKTFVVLRTMRIVEPADRIPFPISRGCDLPMVSFFPIWKSCGLGGM